MPAKPIQFDEPPGITWYGQTTGDSGGCIVFGRDDAGSLKVRIICEMPDGKMRQCDAGFPDGVVVVDWLYKWFHSDEN